MAEVESFQDLSIAEIRVCLGELIFDGDKTNENLAKMSRHPISVGNGIMLSWKSYVKPIPAFLARYGLIPNSVLCPECKHLMTLEYCTDSVGGVVVSLLIRKRMNDLNIYDQ
jgi:hypothetical protein